MDTWEYKIAYGCTTTDKRIKRMNELGEVGWEAIHIESDSPPYIYFKRKLTP